MDKFTTHAEMRARIIREHAGGTTVVVLAKKYGTTHPTILNMISRRYRKVKFRITRKMTTEFGLESAMPHFKLANGKDKK